jgi:hypothetical protein
MAPVAPMGYPSAMELPLTLSFKINAQAADVVQGDGGKRIARFRQVDVGHP